MQFVIYFGLLLVGFISLIKGADWFVDGASKIAEKFNVSKMLIGLTIVSFGTSAPEFAVSVQSLLSGDGDITLGNVIGSNILNILLILGLSSMFGVLKVKDATVKKELPVMILITLAFMTVLVDKAFGLSENVVTRQDGAILLLFFGIFVHYLFKMAIKGDKNTKKAEEDKAAKLTLEKANGGNKMAELALKGAEENEKNETGVQGIKQDGVMKIILMTAAGMVGIIIGSDFVVKGAAEIAAMIGVSQRMISLTIVALGTSLPELVTSVMATRKGEFDIAIGNVVGSNIFNIGIVVGLAVTILGGVSVGAFSYVDILMMLVSAVMLYLFARDGRKIGWKKGIAFLVVFVVYYGYVVMSGVA